MCNGGYVQVTMGEAESTEKSVLGFEILFGKYLFPTCWPCSAAKHNSWWQSTIVADNGKTKAGGS